MLLDPLDGCQKMSAAMATFRIRFDAHFLLAMSVIALGCRDLPCRGAESAVNAKQPNILWLIGENIGHDLGCYGAQQVETPNLDRLARDGVCYTNVFSTNPACAPSRSAFFTGLYQTT